MTYKTVMVHVNDERRAGPLIDVAVNVAERAEAHLIGLFVVPSAIIGAMPGIGGGIAFGSGLAEKERAVFRDAAASLKSKFDAAVKGRPVVAEWRTVDVDVGQPDCAAVALDHARSVDLVVAGQADEFVGLLLVAGLPRSSRDGERAANPHRAVYGQIPQCWKECAGGLERAARSRACRVRRPAPPAASRRRAHSLGRSGCAFGYAGYRAGCRDRGFARTPWCTCRSRQDVARRYRYRQCSVVTGCRLWRRSPCHGLLWPFPASGVRAWWG